MSDESKSITLQDPRYDEGPFPETVVHMHMDGAQRKYIPVDGDELREMLAKERAKAYEEVQAILVQPEMWEERVRRALSLVTDHLTRPPSAT